MEFKELSYEQKFKEKTGLTFNNFYNKYYPKLVWQLKKFNINDIDAEGFANEAFIQSIDKIDQYNSNDKSYHYSTWLFTIAKNIVRQDKNKKHNKNTIIVDTNDSEGNDETAFNALKYHINAKIDSYNEELECDTIINQKYLLTLEEINKLKPIYKTILIMRDIEEYSYEEIAEELNISLQTVKNRLFHGRAIIEKNTKRKFEELINN